MKSIVKTRKRRGVYVNPEIWRLRSTGERRIITMDRGSTILPNMVGMTFKIHNGQRYTEITATPKQVGHKLGEFALTKRLGPSIHRTKKNIKKKRKFR